MKILQDEEGRGALNNAILTRNLKVHIGIAEPEIALLAITSDQALGSSILESHEFF